MLPHFASNTFSNSSNSLNITKNDIGIIISSQNLAYGLSKFFFGILSDIASCRILFGSGLFLSGLMNIGFKKEIQIYNLYILSFLIGLAQGPAWPTCAKILKNWIPKGQFGTWWSIVSTSSNIAGALGPLAATFIALNYHWSIGFMILGCICMSVGYLSIIVLRNKPSDVGYKDMTDEEDEDKQVAEDFDSDSDNGQEENKVSRWQQSKLMLKYPFFTSICLVYFLVQLLKTLYSDVAQLYLIKVVKVDPYTASYFVSSFELSGIFGSIFSGVLTDMIFHCRTKNKQKTTKKSNVPSKLTETPIAIRFVLICIYVIALIICMHLFNYYVKVGSSHLLIYTISTISGSLCYGSISLLGIMAMEFTTDEYSGTSHAIAALAANIGAIFAGLPFSLISKYYSWNFTFKLVEYFGIFVLLLLLIFRKSPKYFEPVSLQKKSQ